MWSQQKKSILQVFRHQVRGRFRESRGCVSPGCPEAQRLVEHEVLDQHGHRWGRRSAFSSKEEEIFFNNTDHFSELATKTKFVRNLRARISTSAKLMWVEDFTGADFPDFFLVNHGLWVTRNYTDKCAVEKRAARLIRGAARFFRSPNEENGVVSRSGRADSKNTLRATTGLSSLFPGVPRTSPSYIARQQSSLLNPREIVSHNKESAIRTPVSNLFSWFSKSFVSDPSVPQSLKKLLTDKKELRYDELTPMEQKALARLVAKQYAEQHPSRREALGRRSTIETRASARFLTEKSSKSESLPGMHWFALPHVDWHATIRDRAVQHRNMCAARHYEPLAKKLGVAEHIHPQDRGWGDGHHLLDHHTDKVARALLKKIHEACE